MKCSLMKHLFYFELYVCVYVGRYVHVRVGTYRGQKRHLIPEDRSQFTLGLGNK